MKQFGLRLHEADSTARSDPADGGDVIDLRRVLAVVRRQARPIILSCLFALACGAAYVLTTPPGYYAQARVLVDDRLARLTEEVTDRSPPPLADDSAILNQIQLVQSQSLAATVIDRLGLDAEPAFTDPPKSGLSALVATLKAPLVWVKSAIAPSAPPPAAALSPEDAAAAERSEMALDLAGEIRAMQVGRSTVIEIGYLSSDPTVAADVVNAYADAFVADQVEANLAATQSTTDWLQTRLAKLQQDAQQAARAVEDYKAEQGLAAVQGELVTEQKLADLNAELAAALAEAARSAALVRQHERVLEAGPAAALATLDTAAPATGTEIDRMAGLQERFAALEERLAEVSASFGPDHPQTRELTAARDETAREIMREVRRRAESARAELDAAEARVEALRASVAEAQEQNTVAVQAQVELRDLEQRAATLRGIYQEFSSRQEAMGLRETYPVSNVRVLSRAETPEDPALPRTMQVGAAALLLGLLGGLGIGLVREFRDRVLRTGDDVQDLTGLPFLGYLPALPAASGAADTRPAPKRRGAPPGAEANRWSPLLAAPHFFTVITEPYGVFCETLRNVRLAADMAIVPGSGRVLGVVSPLPGEGKSTVAANLANLLARSGKRVLLIDADIRHPGLSRALGVTGPGLAEVLLGEAQATAAIRRIAETGLDILPCTPTGEIAYGGELLQLPAARTLLAEARKVYDYLVVDLPPLGPVVDAKAMLPSLDRVLMVAEWGRTPRDLLRQLLRREPGLATHILGVVLNKVDMRDLPRYAADDGAEKYLESYASYYAAR